MFEWRHSLRWRRAASLNPACFRPKEFSVKVRFAVFGAWLLGAMAFFDVAATQAADSAAPAAGAKKIRVLMVTQSTASSMAP